MFPGATRRGDVLGQLRHRLTYGNVMATVAVFIALGGTSYALTLPRNSVGARELRPRSVGASELKTAAVTSRDIKNRAIQLNDLSRRTRSKLRGPQGPQGSPGAPAAKYFAAVDAGGGVAVGAARVNTVGIGAQRLDFPTSVAGCAYSATLAKVAGGAPEDPPPGASITVAPTGDGGVLVRTWDAANQAKGLPFHLIVAC
jgi:hypothetical protein